MGPIYANDIISVVAAIERALIKLSYEARLGSGVSRTQEVLKAFDL